MKALSILIAISVLMLSCITESHGHLRNLAVENCFVPFFNICLVCNVRYYLSSGKCERVSDLCKLYGILTGTCFSCYEGSYLSNGMCFENEVPTEEPTEEPSGSGVICYFRQVNINGVCVQVNDLCQTWSNVTAECTSCYQGYYLLNGNCPVGNGQPQGVICYNRQVKINGMCIQVSDLCQTWSNVTSECLSCYQGYYLSNGVCHVGSGEEPSEEPSGSGVVCYFRQVKINGVCVNVNDLCKTWSESTGQCTSCYGGYTLTNGICHV